MKNLIWEWIKKDWLIVVMAIAVVIFILLFAINKALAIRFEEKVTTLEAQYLDVQKERERLQSDFDVLSRDYDKKVLQRDSIQLALNASRKQLKDLEKQHQAEIDSLLKIPNDTIYMRLGAIYPNYDADVLKYPFAGSQIRSIYTTAISFPRLQSEYALQGKSLNSCFALNESYKKTEINLLSQVDNCTKNLALANDQIDNRNKSLDAYIKKNKQKGFWMKVLGITAGIGWGVAVLK